MGHRHVATREEAEALTGPSFDLRVDNGAPFEPFKPFEVCLCDKCKTIWHHTGDTEEAIKAGKYDSMFAMLANEPAKYIEWYPQLVAVSMLWFEALPIPSSIPASLEGKSAQAYVLDRCVILSQEFSGIIGDITIRKTIGRAPDGCGDEWLKTLPVVYLSTPATGEPS